MNYYLCGKIQTTHGLKGELKVKSTSDFNRFAVGSIIYIKQKGEYIKLEVVTTRFHKGCYLVSFKGMQDINLVEHLKNVDLYVDEEAHTLLDEDEFYYDELINKEVYFDNDEYIGVTKSILELPQGHYLEVIKDDGKKVLIPFRKEFIKDVFDDAIEVFYLEGLV